jgi:hypothetical protein
MGSFRIIYDFCWLKKIDYFSIIKPRKTKTKEKREKIKKEKLEA